LSDAVKISSVKKYYGDVKALDGVSLSVKEGSVYALLGPNGAGKTTLIKAMATLLRVDSGDVLVGGVDASKHPAQIRSMIGLTGQFASVDEFLTGRENMEMVGRLYHLDSETAKVRTRELLKKFRLTDAADAQVKTYSGGMRRRLDLGASLIGEPAMLFLDEPTTGLDPRTRLELWDIIRELTAGGTTILLTTQYLDEADELADLIGVIDHGKLIAEGTSNELKNKLGGDVVEFSLSSDSQCKKALEAVRKVAKKSPTYNKQDKTISVPVVDGSKSLLRIAKALDDSKLEPIEISLHRPSLDDVFLTLTGQKTEIDEKPKSRRGKK